MKIVCSSVHPDSNDVKISRNISKRVSNKQNNGAFEGFSSYDKMS